VNYTVVTLFTLFISQSENFSGATTAVPLSTKKTDAEATMDDLTKMIEQDSALSLTKGRGRKKMNNNSVTNSSSKLATPGVSGNLSSYDTDDQTDKMMDMLVKTATSTEKRTRIRKNRKKEATSTRKSG